MISTQPSECAPVQAVTPQREGQSSRPAMSRILVVDDDEVLSRFLERILRAEGFAVEFAHNGADALETIRPDLDLVILDLNLPQLDGIAVLHKLRPIFPKLPVLVLTGRSRAESTVQALESGADDCLIKPFSYLELLARVRALLRRNTGFLPRSSQCADLVLQREELRVTRGGQKIDLTPREYGLIEFLMRTPRVPVPRSVLLKEVWGLEYDPSTNVVDVYMKYVRDKIDRPGLPKLIRTIRGLGYVVSED